MTPSRAARLLARLHSPVFGRGPLPWARWWLEDGYRPTPHRSRRTR